VAEASIVIIPGLGGSGPDHWQSLWQQAEPRYRRVVQRNWDEPSLADWVDELDRQVAALVGPVILVAHSLACALVAHWARQARPSVAAALLVSPSDVDSPAHTPQVVRVFSPLPLARLPFASTVVYSRNDPYVDPARAVHFARCWGSRAIDAGTAGHINTDSGHGPWPEGRAILGDLITCLLTKPRCSSGYPITPRPAPPPQGGRGKLN
jgi:predicted alpha/beta hydrolase family esterase